MTYRGVCPRIGSSGRQVPVEEAADYGRGTRTGRGGRLGCRPQRRLQVAALQLASLGMQRPASWNFARGAARLCLRAGTGRELCTGMRCSIHRLTGCGERSFCNRLPLATQ
jgi:hypothetical protein